MSSSQESVSSVSITNWPLFRAQPLFRKETATLSPTLEILPLRDNGRRERIKITERRRLYSNFRMECGRFDVGSSKKSRFNPPVYPRSRYICFGKMQQLLDSALKDGKRCYAFTRHQVQKSKFENGCKNWNLYEFYQGFTEQVERFSVTFTKRKLFSLFSKLYFGA